MSFDAARVIREIRLGTNPYLPAKSAKAAKEEPNFSGISSFSRGSATEPQFEPLAGERCRHCQEDAAVGRDVYICRVCGFEVPVPNRFTHRCSGWDRKRLRRHHRSLSTEEREIWSDEFTGALEAHPDLGEVEAARRASALVERRRARAESKDLPPAQAPAATPLHDAKLGRIASEAGAAPLSGSETILAAEREGAQIRHHSGP